jgi:hypothetical protein
MTHNESSRALFDHDSFERLQLQANLQRANFMRNNAGLTFLTAGSIGLACVLAMVLIPEDSADRRTTFETVVQAESQSTKRTVEATEQIEKLATLVKHAKAIAPNTAQEISQLIRQPSYDCNQVACWADLERRNYCARSKLEALLAKKALPDQTAIDGDTSAELTHLVERLK